MLEREATLLSTLPETPGDLVPLVERLANHNTGSTNVAGLRTFEEELRQLFEPLADSVDVHDLEPLVRLDASGERVTQPLGRVLRFRARDQAARQLILVGHYDTVFDPSHAFQHARIDGDRLRGPGTADMKGGLVILASALAAFERSEESGSVGWEVFVNPDEELGSVGSATLLAEAAGGKQLGLVFEPSLPDGGLAGARKGSGTFTVEVRGRAAHAGRDHADGRNAIAALASITTAINDLNGRWPEVTINPGVVRGGDKTNIVPDRASLDLNIRVPTADAGADVVDAMTAICRGATTDGITVTFDGAFTRPPKPLDATQQAVLGAAVTAGAEIGLNLSVHPTGGVSDGNNLYAAGVPNIDNLGVHGANIHSAEEFMWIDSLVERSRLATLLMLRFAREEIAP